jgi:hypothetical protein
MRLFAPLSRMKASCRGWVRADENIDWRYRAVAVTRSGNRNTLDGSVLNGCRTSEQLRSKNAQTPAKTGHHQGPEDEARHHDTQPCTVCKTSIPGSNPGGASKIPEEIQRLTVRRGPRSGSTVPELCPSRSEAGGTG